MNCLNKVNKMESKKKFKTSDIVVIVILAICIVVAGIALYMYYSIENDYEKSDELYRNTANEFTVRNGDPNAPWYEMLAVNMDGLKAKNNEIIGWLFFENEDISYPILRSEDNEKYFRTAYDGTQSGAGSIFMESKNAGDFNDLHTIIYGHNMKNLSMFGRLKNYKEDDSYYDSHKFFQIITPNKKYRCEVVAYKDADAEGSFYTIYKPEGKDFKKFVEDEILKGSLISTNPDIKDDSRIVSLSTCTASDEKRFVVSGLRVDEKDVDSSFMPTNVKETKIETKDKNYIFLILGIIFIVVDITAIIWIIVKRNKTSR